MHKRLKKICADLFIERKLTIIDNKGIKVFNISPKAQCIAFFSLLLFLIIANFSFASYILGFKKQKLQQEKVQELIQINESLLTYTMNLNKDLSSLYDAFSTERDRLENAEDIYHNSDDLKKKITLPEIFWQNKLATELQSQSANLTAKVFDMTNFYLASFVDVVEQLGIKTEQLNIFSETQIDKIRKSSIPSHMSTYLEKYNDKKDSMIIKSLSLGGFNSQEGSDLAFAGMKKLRDFVFDLPLGCPMKNSYRVTSHYGSRVHPVARVKMPHNGIDLVSSVRSPIVASGNGVVANASYSPGYGFNVLIRHGKDSNAIETRYAHLASLKVAKGQKIKEGEILGYQGSSGVATGEHLHYEITFKKNFLDPINFLIKIFSYETIAKLKSNK